MLNRMLKIAAAALAALLLTSCGGGTVHGVDLAITDGPIDLASAVNISFSQIELIGPSVTPTVLNISPASTLDLYQLQGGIAATIVQAIQAQPGHYTAITLTVAADQGSGQSNITLPDGTHILYIPTGVSPRVVVPVDFNFVGGTDLGLTVDFDLRKSIISDPNDPTKYQLIPHIRAVVTQDTGSITGTVATALVTCLEPAIYVYQGDVTPTDVDITAPASRLQPISTALVGFNSTTSLYNFTVSFLPAGKYTVAYTCEAPLDVANQSNTITFTKVITATVQDQNTTFVTLE